MSKDYVNIQKEDVRVLVFDKTPDSPSRSMHVNIVVGSEDMTITRFDFHRLLELMTAARRLEREHV